MKDLILNNKVDRLIADELADLDDFEKLNKLSELIEVFSQEVPATLAELRIAHVRRLTELYTRDDIQANTRLSQSRIRKLVDR
jgi:hypothetical protein